MIIKMEQCPLQKDIEITIKYPEKARIIERIVSLLKSVDKKIECFSEDTVKIVNISEIYYIESLEKKTFIYCEKMSYQTKYRLYQLIEKLADNGFVQINKYCLMNINKMDNIKPLFNSRMEALLSNGIRLHVTRRYLAGLKQKLYEDV